ncbi:MAG TPA: hypothetical protein VNT51_08335, partial [Miltoncostaeaceae bacterium]|nr:hypothetical protein [Miltoncostaeaceae bacterium]
MSRRLLAGLAGAGAALGAAAALAAAAFWAETATTLTAAAAPDWTPPGVTATVIAKTEGGVAGFVRPSGSYRVYASFADTGNPASGLASATSDSTELTAASGAQALTATGGPWTVDGVAYTHRSASLSVDGGASAGARTYALTPADAAGNAAASTGHGVTVDATAPAATDVQTANGGATAGRPEAGDSITFTFSEPLDAESVLSGWTGAATPVVVRISNGFLVANDTLAVRNAANTASLPLTPSELTLGNAFYVNADTTFGASGTASTMTLSGSTITVVLGTPSATATTGGAGTMSWTPGTALRDRAGNTVPG